jgi:outer membrane protein OmpA-like peptidoglycan-associated protein
VASELLGGVTWDLPWIPLALFAAGGGGLTRGYGTPDFRVLAGARFTWAPAPDTDGDGLTDDVDRCPKDAEDRDQFQDEDGCPDVDDDADRILDVNDRCRLEPETYNGIDDTDGCPDVVPDTDDDGLVDTVDRCPKEAEDKDGFEDDDGCPDPDNDKDTVLDVSDACVMVPGPVENRGCPDADRDGDGIVDRLDQCPDEPGAAPFGGCKQKQLAVLVGDRIDILDKVYFETNKAVILRRSYALLENVAAVIKRNELKRVRVEGHTDSDGAEAANLALSSRRAEAVVKFLEAQGVERARLAPQGFGESKPIASNKTAKGKAENRRVEFIVEDAGARVLPSGNKPE